MNLFKRLAVLAALLFASPAFAATLGASTTADLAADWNMARAGDTISLACATYAMPNLQGRHFSPPLVITSADPSCRPVLQGLKLANASGVIFDGLDLVTYGPSGPVDPYYAFRLTNCGQISFQGVNVHGDPSKVPSQQVNGFYPNGCQGLAFSDSTFKNLSAAIVAQRSAGLHVEHNAFARMAKGALEIGGTSYVDIGDNFFTDFETSAGVHGDAIQIFTSGTTIAAHDINIHGNLITRGAGVTAQGIFVQDEVGSLHFSNVNISDNAVLGMQWNSVMLNGATGSVQITGNLVATWAGPDPVAPPNPSAAFGYGTTNFNGYLRYDGGDANAKANITGNQFQQFILNGKNAAAPAGNTQGGAVNDNGAALEAAWRAAHPVYLAPAA